METRLIQPERNLEIGVCANKNRVGGKAGVTVAFPSEADTADGVVDIFLWRADTQKLKAAKLFADIVWGDKRMFSEAEKRDRLGDPNSGTIFGRAGTGEDNVGVLVEI